MLAGLLLQAPRQQAFLERRVDELTKKKRNHSGLANDLDQPRFGPVSHSSGCRRSTSFELEHRAFSWNRGGQETSTSPKMTRLRGWAPVGERLPGAFPFGHMG